MSLDLDNAIHNCARECALKRANRTCRNRFDCFECNNCRFFIKNYMGNVPSNQIDLYMMQVEFDVGAMKARNSGYSVIWILILIVIGIFAGSYIYFDIKLKEKSQYYENYNNNKSSYVNPPTFTIVDNVDSVLWKVSERLTNKEDVNGDGLVNCIDAAVIFYELFPDKSKVTITLNYNTPKMNHLFNTVNINGTWRAIEPQAYWANKASFYMQDVWGSDYVSSYNQNVTSRYLQYVK